MFTNKNLFDDSADLPLMHKKILVIEDSDDSRDFICMLLRRAGATVENAADGKEGLEKVSRFQPDLLLLDLEMPVLDGFGVIKKLKEQEYSKPILAVTAHATAHDKDRCHEAGFDGYISKPFNSEKLVTVLKEHLASSYQAQPRLI